MAPKRRYWLFKSEPGNYSIDDLWAERGKRTCWDGIRNYQARNLIRDEMKKGDGVLFYHSSCAEPGVVAVAEIVREAYPDHTQFDPKAKYFDERSDPDEPRWLMVDVVGKERLAEPVTLAAIKDNPKLAEMGVVRRGNRLSVQAVTAAEWREVLRMGGVPARV
jgi:predicted RNA-binding protein with PUA-like domain